ncbi:hypothetical protein CCR95_13050 [Thiocystis minor]|uniref:hypothetical protein n=1 Tax=Thiocystis minor TaxID=61597 RepID=UPI0019127092|nr:hypothetical protein [Thiocystis minor]MBK5964985.1 hypothetical protein [Thiocystis minor]
MTSATNHQTPEQKARDEIDRQLDTQDQARIQQAAGGVRFGAIVKALIDAIDPDASALSGRGLMR